VKPASELAVVEPQAVAAVGSAPQLSIQAAFQAIISGDLSHEKLEIVRKLLAMDAEKQFILAFNRMMGRIPVIEAKTVIPNRGKYAKFEHIMEIVLPILKSEGFALSFSSDMLDGTPPRIKATCTISHTAGHSRSGSFTCHVGGRSDSETQSDCKAATTARRNAMNHLLNIVITQDVLTEEHDAGMESENFIATATAAGFEERLLATGSDLDAFLKWVDAPNFARLPAIKLADIESMIRRKEKAS
jgi:hypothetical protein